MAILRIGRYLMATQQEVLIFNPNENGGVTLFSAQIADLKYTRYNIYVSNEMMQNIRKLKPKAR